MLSDHIHTLSKAGRTVEWELGAALSGEDIAYLCPLGAAGEASSLFSTRTQTYARTYMHTHVNAHTHTHTNRHTFFSSAKDSLRIIACCRLLLKTLAGQWEQQ